MGHKTAAKIIIAGGGTVEYDYRGTQRIGETTISGGALMFGTPSTFIVTFTITGPETASAHYHGPGGEADAKLVPTTSGCPNLAPGVADCLCNNRFELLIVLALLQRSGLARPAVGVLNASFLRAITPALGSFV